MVAPIIGAAARLVAKKVAKKIASDKAKKKLHKKIFANPDKGRRIKGFK